MREDNNRETKAKNYQESERVKIIRISPVFVVLPLLAPLLTPLIIVVVSIVATIAMIAISLAGFGGGASAGSIVGAIFGGLIALAVGLAISKAVYYVLPPFLFFLALLLYLGVSITEEVRGHRLKAQVGTYRLNLRFFSFLSVISTGLLTFLIFTMFASYGFFEEEHRRSEQGLGRALGSLERKIVDQIDIIGTFLGPGEYLALGALFCSVAWALWLYLGVNYYVSRSIKYCIDIYLTAFVIDFLFTVISFVTLGAGDTDFKSFVSFFNMVDAWLRLVAMLPVRWFFGLFADFAPLFQAVETLISVLADTVFTALEIGIRTVFFADSALRELVIGFIDFARFLKVDFLFFLLSSLFYFKVRRKKW